MSVFRRMFPIAGCNPVGITSRVAPSGSIPSSSTKNLLSESKHGVGASLLTKNELGSIPSRTAKQLGAVVGYGVALQASCLEGFDSLGLHQLWTSCISWEVRRGI